ncbi:MAG: nickel pincer cofactor biosynthesis protein LarB [Planctomycetota bacterium]|nr:nickel pincer cofactor biosynthesis protein LarB [Planctomycetota bacterium]
MDAKRLSELLNAVAQGALSPDEAAERLRHMPFEDLGFAKLDHHRALRCGFPEVVFCQGKTTEQVLAIVGRLAERGATVLATRAGPDLYGAVRAAHPKAVYHESARAIVLAQEGESVRLPGRVAVVSAGTSDQPVAEEARVTAEFLGCRVETFYDVGVAGIHRLLAHSKALAEASVVIVVAGMEGALASVVGGLVDVPVIAVPTSVGYGACFGGLAPLLTMLNSCAAGVGVVNIDNGFGAGCLAAMILRSAGRLAENRPEADT